MPTARKNVVEARRTKKPRPISAKLKRLVTALGPGLITGATDDDPSGIATYTQAGAQLGLTMLWTALFSFPLMATVQYVCAKIGLIAGRGLASVIKQHYPRWVLYLAVLLLVVANTINVGADLGAIAATLHLLIPPIPAEVAIFPVSALIVIGLAFGSYEKIVAIFKWLTLSLFAYVLAACLTWPPWLEVLQHTLIPQMQFTDSYIKMFVAILGTTISPYLFFWQSNMEVEKQKNDQLEGTASGGASDDDLKYAATDVNSGMFISNLVMYFIILGSAATLHIAGTTNVQSADQAARALQPVAGNLASALFSLGIIGTGVLAIPVLAGSSAFALTEAFGWPRGLEEKPWQAKQFYAIIAVSTAIGVALNFFHINPMTALFYTAVINGVLAPPLLALLMLISGSRKIMGDQANGKLVNILGWLTVVVMTAAAVALLVTSI